MMGLALKIYSIFNPPSSLLVCVLMQCSLESACCTMDFVRYENHIYKSPVSIKLKTTVQLCLYSISTMLGIFSFLILSLKSSIY